MVVEHGECPRPRGCGELGFAAGRGIDVLTVNDPWAKEVENTQGQDRIVTADKMDEGQGSTEKVEKTGELLEALDGQPTWSSALGTAHRCRRPASRRLLVRPVVRWRPEGFGFVKVDGADAFAHVSVVRGPLGGVFGCKVVVFLEVDVPPRR